jgi:rod shape-determining protein MreC
VWSLTSRQTAVLIAIFVFVSVGFISLDRQDQLDTLKNPLTALSRPVIHLFSNAGGRAATIGSQSDSPIAAELAALTAERDRLLAENARLKALQQELNQLRQQLGFLEAHPGLKAIPATIVSRDPEGLQRFLVIDRGSNDGITEGMAVVSPDFFVGQVMDVEPSRSRIILSIDVSYQVGAVVQGESHAEGVVFGRWQEGGRLQMRHLDPATQVAEGDLVVTSGRTAMVPEGLVIGKVYHIERDIQAESLSLELAPLVDFAKLQSVMVIVADGSD